MEDIFVGRVQCTENFKAAWNRGHYKIFGIYGPKSVGKTRYVKNFLRILRTSEKSDKMKTITLDFQCIRTYEAYIATVAGYLNIPKYDVCSHKNCQCIQKVIKVLKDCDDVYIFHHDHQEEAKAKPDSDGNLPDSTKQSLWDQIYVEVIKPLLTECSNFYLIISSMDEFRFAELRRVFWMQKLPALTEEECLELLNDVCPSSDEVTNARRHVVRLCEGIPPAIINAGLLMKDNVISVDEVIHLMVKQIVEVLSDEFLPHPERINTQLQHRWKHLSQEQSDNLVKTLFIIKYTSKSTIKANAKLLKYKFNHLLPLLRRNLLTYNKDDETISTCPLIKHILEAVNYIKADNIGKKLHEQIKAILEPQMQNGSECCTFDSNEKPSSTNSATMRNDLCACHQNSFDARDTQKCFSKVPVEHENKFSDGIPAQEVGPVDSKSNLRSRHDSFIGHNLNRKSLVDEKHYKDKDIVKTSLSFHLEQMSLGADEFRQLNCKQNIHGNYTCTNENLENHLSTDDNTSDDNTYRKRRLDSS
ncbi:uncharacterized protein LOC134231759 isoform X2 [Saccostrea cucullata]|uniref:uncharacterized protein LOC134231759 isoform X2 n=1 Tax=Saccostrea cuccullata TaxID=36930 RepID=UPI002ED007F8